MIYSPDSRVTLYRESLARLPRSPREAQFRQKLLLIRLNMKLNLLETLVAPEFRPETTPFPQIEASAAVKDAVQDLNQLKSTFNIGPDLMKRTGYYLRVCLARIKVDSRLNWRDTYMKHMLLIKKDTARGPQACYTEAALAAKALYQRTGHSTWKERSEILCKRKEEHYFQVSGDILTPLMEHSESISSSDMDFNTMSEQEVRRVAEWYENYEHEHPDFAIPVIAHQACGLKLRLYRGLHDDSRARSEELKLNHWNDQLPSNSQLVSSHKKLTVYLVMRL